MRRARRLARRIPLPTSRAGRSLCAPSTWTRSSGPGAVAVVGASDTNARPNTALTQKITTWAEERGATVYYVNPNRPTVAGRPAVKALTDISDQLDLVAILVGEPLPILKDAVAAGAKFAVVFAAGFAEVGAKGERIQARDGEDHRQRRPPRARS